MEGDRADGGKGGRLGGDTVGDGYAEVGWHPVELGVVGVLVAGARHPLPHPELVGALTYLDHTPASE